jgi:large subunit ribosomal protein L23
MGLFTKKTSDKANSVTDDKKKSSKTPKASEVDVKDEILTPESQQNATVKKDAKASKVVPTKAAKGQAGDSYKVLLSPKVSERAAELAAKNIYVFNVPVTAEKINIAKSVELLYGVKVEKVRTARGEGKPIYRGHKKGRRNQWKKAFVSVKKGQTIDLYEGV